MSSSIKINSQGNLSGGYFIPNKAQTNVTWRGSEDFYVTLPEEQTIKREIIKLIREAKSSLKICSFIITDKEVFTEIQKVVKDKNVAVFILTQLDKRKFSSSLLSEEEMFQNFNQVHLDIIKKLYSNGAHVRATQTAHAKFVISDRKKAFLTSANLTEASLTNNPESGLYINDTATCKHLDEVFNEIFINGTEYTRFISASRSKQFVVSRSSDLTKDAIALTKSSDLRFTYGNMHRSLFDELIKIIRKSSGDIYLSTYSVVGLSSIPELLSAIKSKIDEGISIFIFARGMNHRNDHLDGCATLSSLGCIIYGDVYNHSKGIISPETGMIFTANVDGKHGLINGFEVGAIVKENQKANMEHFIKWQIESAPYIFHLNPTKQEYQEYYSFHCEKREIVPLELSEKIKIRIKKSNDSLVNLIDKTPCYLKLQDQKVSFIEIKENIYEASFKDDLLTIGKKVYLKEHHLESYLLRFSEADIIIE